MVASRKASRSTEEEARKIGRTAREVLAWAPLLVFVVIIGFQLLGPVPFGLANNNDFARVLAPLGLWPRAGSPHVYFTYFVNDYVTGGQRWDSGVPSSEWLVAALAKKIAGVVLPPGTFQLRIMGLIHVSILTLALIIFLHALHRRRLWVRCVGGLLLVFVWTDLMYVQQFNTAYTDAGAIMALAVVFAISIECLLVSSRWFWAVGFVLASCFLIGTKTQHETTLPALLAFCLLAAVRAPRRRDRVAWLCAPVLILGAALWMLVKTPSDYRAAPAFTVVFYKLAVLSPDPKRVLADFHMPEDEFLKYVGHFAYQPIAPMDDDQFRERIVSLVTLSSLSRFYWRHPDILRKVLVFDFRGSAPNVDLTLAGPKYGLLREGDVRSGKRPFVLPYWSAFRRWLFRVAPFHLVWLFGWVILFGGACVAKPGIGRFVSIWPAVLMATLVAIPSFVFASLLDAIETARHLVFFQAATDLTIFSLALAGLLAIEELVSKEAGSADERNGSESALGREAGSLIGRRT